MNRDIYFIYKKAEKFHNIARDFSGFGWVNYDKCINDNVGHLVLPPHGIKIFKYEEFDPDVPEVYLS